MTRIGFSTGAVALGDFRSAISIIQGTPMTALELSAIRLPELPSLIEALPALKLRGFEYVAVHAPSQFSKEEEGYVIGLLEKVNPEWPIILHPDTIHKPENWAHLGNRLAIENMDRRKKDGRTADELACWFNLLPNARLCFDLAHAHQVDRTMTEGYRILRSFRDRICQVHISELDSTGHHFPLSFGSMRAFLEISSMIPVDAAVIIESLIPKQLKDPEMMRKWIEMEAMRACLALGRVETTAPHAISLQYPAFRVLKSI